MAAGREQFGSNLAAIMAMAGSAIGLGNIWRFPYMVGQGGGAAFVLVYLLCVVFLSVPILLCETIIGRRAQSGTIGAMEKLAPGTRWKWLGILTVLSPLIILSFYSVVGGWSIGFFFKSLSQGFNVNDTGVFSSFTSSLWMPLVCNTLFILATAGVVAAGVKSGIERFNRISLPLLFVFILAIMIYSLSLKGSSEGVSYLLKPDFSRMGPRVLADAMGQAFFSLSLGVGTILTYSSYMKKEDNIVRSGMGTAFFDLAFAVLAGFAVIPAVFAAGIEPGAGPGLIFETLPFVFASMGEQIPLISRVISIIFFLTVVIAALTSSISMFEVGVAYLVEEKHITRRRAVLYIFLGTWALGSLCAVFPAVFDFCDTLTSNYLMTFGSLLFVLFVGWKMKRSDVWGEFTGEGSQQGNARAFRIFYFFVRYAAPVVILLIFLSNLL